MPSYPDSDSSPVEAHLDSLTIAAILDGGLEASERTVVEEHLASCARCRMEVHEVRQLIRLAPTQRPRRIPWVALSAVAAAIALYVVVPRPEVPSPPEQPALERSAAALATRSLFAEGPVGNVVTPGRLRFTWESLGAGGRYELTIVDSLGGALWRTETSDTFLVLPPSVSLPPRGRLYWYVDGFGADARVRTTRAIPFRLER